MHGPCQYHKGKNMVVSDEPRARTVKPQNFKIGVWKENLRWRARPEWKYTSSFLMEKYVQKQHKSVFGRLGGHKWERSPVYNQCMRMMDEYEGVRHYKVTGYHHGSQNFPGGYWDWRLVRHREITSPREVAEASMGNQAAVDCSMSVEEREPRDEGSWVSEAIVLVGSVPC
jgi:hypothetical protein